MRLTGLTLASYGNFKSERITFDPTPGAINLLVAPNGAGKSVLRTAFCDLLFGIGGQSPMGFRYPYSAMRIMAEAIDPDGKPFTFGRRKGQGNTLIDAEGATLDPATVVRLLGRVDRTRLERVFALDTELLRRGQANLLASDGELAAALVSGAGGTQDLRALRKSLEQSRDSLAPTRRSSQRPFYVALDRFVEARKLEQRSLLGPDQWEKLQQEVDQAKHLCDKQNRIVDTESAEIARLERIRRVVPWLAAHDVAVAWLDAHPDAPVLDPGLAPRLAEARHAIVIAEERTKRERQTVGTLANQLETIVVDDLLLAEADEIDRLVVASGAARKATADLPAIQSEQHAHGTAVAARLRELGSSLPIEQAANAIPPRAALNRARRLIKAFTARQESVQAAPARIAELETERDTIVAQQAALLAPADVQDLEALVKEIRADGDPARHKREAVVRRTDAAANLAAALARVPGWTHGDAALIALAPLPSETYDRQAEAVDARQSETRDRHAALQAARATRDEAQKRLDALTSADALPDVDALTQARARRDDGWQLIYRLAFTADSPSQPETDAFAGTLPLPLAYERAVTSADRIADRRVQEAAVIERAQIAKTALLESEQRVQEAEAQHQLALEAQRTTALGWSQICAILPLGEAPGKREVHAFLVARDKVIDAHSILGGMETAETMLDASHASWAARLSALMAAPTETPLTELLATTDKRLNEAQRAEKTRAGLEARREHTDKSLTNARSQMAAALRALAEWREEWAAAMRELGRPADEDPHETDDLLQVWADLDQAQKALVSDTKRVTDIQRDNTRFAAEAAALALRIAPTLDRTEPFVLISTLRQRLQQARELATQRDLLREHARNALASAELAERMVADRQAALHAILVLIGADTVETAEQRLISSADRAQHAAKLEEAEAKLLEAGDLRPLPELREEAGAVPSAEIPGRIDRAAQRRQDAQSAAQRAAATASALEEQMKQKAEDTGMTDAVAEQQSAIATIGRVLEEALVHHIAAEMLDQALKAVESQSEPEILRRISELFTALTSGAYSRVLTEIGDDNVTHLVLTQRDFPDERQAVQQLSEGTRDQLFLALRLAAIEQHAAAGPGLPFIGDDILQTFDDDRALAALRVLGEVSRTVQVVLLTHHRHVIELARQLVPGSVHICRIGSAAMAAE